jgi:hypothetical protein
MWSGLEEEPAVGFEPTAYGLRTLGYQFFAGYQRPSDLKNQGAVYVIVFL